MDETACEDLKAFERRFTEIIAVKQPAAGRWRILLVVTSVCTAIGAYQWLSDPTTMDAGFLESLGNHLFFTVSLIILLILFFGCGIHKRVVAPSIIASRCRSVLSDFNLSCDDVACIICRRTDAAWEGKTKIEQCRSVLSDFNLSCDDHGKLILKPRPTTP